MKFTASQSKLRNALQRAKVATQGRNFLPAASCVWMGPEYNTVALACSNGNMQVMEQAEVGWAAHGTSMVNCRHLLDAVNRLGGEIEIESNKGKLEIRRGESSVVIPEEKSDGFAWLKAESGQSFQMPENEIRMGLRRVIGSVEDRTSFADRRGVLVEIEAQRLIFGSTTGNAISVSEYLFQHDLPKTRAAIPREPAIALLSLLGESDAPATVKIGEAMIEVSFGSTVFTSKLAAEEFPNLHRAFGMINEPQFKLVLNREEWIDALDLISTAKDESKWTGADVQLDNGKVTLSASGASSATTSILAKFSGSLKFRVDAGLLRDILSGLDSPTFTLEMTDHLDPLVIRAGPFVGLVCPLRK